MRKPETCWAVFKWQVINSIICCIWLVDSVESTMMHGLAKPKFINIQWCLFNLPDSIKNGRATTLSIKTLIVTAVDNDKFSVVMDFGFLHRVTPKMMLARSCHTSEQTQKTIVWITTTTIIIHFSLMFFDVLTRESEDQLQSASAQNIHKIIRGKTGKGYKAQLKKILQFTYL
jgi:hypothetical protein